MEIFLGTRHTLNANSSFSLSRGVHITYNYESIFLDIVLAPVRPTNKVATCFAESSDIITQEQRDLSYYNGTTRKNMGGKTSPNHFVAANLRSMRTSSFDTARISNAKALKNTRIRPSFISANPRTCLYARRTSKQRPLRVSCLPTLEAAVDGLARISRSSWPFRIGPLLPFAAIRSCLLPRECSGAHS